MPEMWDILDENGHRTGMTAERWSMIDDQAAGYHLVVHVYITNRQSQWLIQKRSASKEIWPGLWDVTGGAALAGEDSLSAARREVEEEIGIQLDPAQMFVEGRLQRKHNLIDIWVARADFAIDDCRLDPIEVTAVRWVDADSLIEILFEGEHRDDEYKSIVAGFAPSRIIRVDEK
jgi:8-oxo-dGTP diphosphatase